MRRKYRYLVIAILLTGLLSAIPAHAVDNRYRVAVLPFDDGSIQARWWGNRWDVGRGVADALITELLNTNQFRLVERQQINQLLDEQDFGAAGRVDPGTAAKIGKILGVQYLITGRITEFSNDSKGATVIIPQNAFGINLRKHTARVAIEARLVDTSTAEIKTSVTGQGEKKQTNLGLIANWNVIAFGSKEFQKTNLGIAMRDAVKSVADQLTVAAYPQGGTQLSGPFSCLVADTFGNKVYITAGAADGAQPGMTLIVNHIVRVVKNPQTGEVIDQVTEPVAEIAVTEVKEKSSVGVVVTKLSTKYSISPNDLVVEKQPHAPDSSGK